MPPSNSQARNTKQISLNILRSKYNLVMKFGQFMQYCKREIFAKNFYEKWDLETSFRYFLILKESSVKNNQRGPAFRF